MIPTEPGYYWAKKVGGLPDPQPVWVRQVANMDDVSLVVIIIGSNQEFRIADFTDDWRRIWNPFAQGEKK